jgi:hypothetical protein
MRPAWILAQLIGFQWTFFHWDFFMSILCRNFTYIHIIFMAKRRSDRNHIIYEIINTRNNKRYVGLTVARGRAYNKSVRIRFHQHCVRALEENKNWALYEDMRKYEPNVYEIRIIDIVRGKAEAHRLETHYIHNYDYKLNSTIKNK